MSYGDTLAVSATGVTDVPKWKLGRITDCWNLGFLVLILAGSPPVLGRWEGRDGFRPLVAGQGMESFGMS